MKLDFTLRDGTVVKKDFITKTSKKFKYHETDKLRLVKVPYNEGGCYMILALPIDEERHIGRLFDWSPFGNGIRALNSEMSQKFPYFGMRIRIDSFKMTFSWK